MTTTPGGTVVFGSARQAHRHSSSHRRLTITFVLTNPDGTARDTETVTVNGNGDYTTPNGFTPNVTGTWHWAVTYSGDGNNLNATGSNA